MCVGLLVFGITGITNAYNITIPDGQGTDFEDNETEPGTATGQLWDLEAFFFEGTLLTLVGGWDFENGVPADSGGGPNSNWDPGDIFIDVQGDAMFPAPPYSPSPWGYEYAVQMTGFNSDGTLDYDIFRTTDSGVTVLKTDGVPQSNPWKVISTNQAAGSGQGRHWAGLSDTQVETLFGEKLLGVWEGMPDDGLQTHFAIQIDIADLPGGPAPNYTPGNEMIFHYTMECGNDVIMGAIPEPATILLIGLGLIGIAAVGRKRVKK